MELPSFPQCTTCHTPIPSFDTSLITYTCKHIHCPTCLYQTFFTNQFTILANFISTDIIEIPCPLCSTGIYQTTSSSFMSLLKQLLSPSSSTTAQLPCLKHSKQPTKYCVQCEQWFCNQCIAIHNEIGNKHHTLSSSCPKKPVQCTVHGSKVKYYCINCATTICSCCLTLEHKEHNITHISQFINESKLHINDVLNCDLSKVMYELVKTKTQFENVYKEEYANNLVQLELLIEALTKIKNDYIDKMNQLHTNQMHINTILQMVYEKLNRDMNDICKSYINDIEINTVLFVNSIFNINININANTEQQQQYSMKTSRINSSNDLIMSTQCTEIPKLNIDKLNQVNYKSTASRNNHVNSFHSNSHTVVNVTQQSKFETFEDMQTLTTTNTNANTNAVYHTTSIKRYSELKCINTIHAHSKQIRCLLELPEQRLASGSYKEIKIWSLTESSSCKLLATLQGHDSFIYSMLMLVNGNLASCSEDEIMIIWDITSGSYKQLQKIKGQTHFANSILLLPTGLVVSITEDTKCISIRNPEDNYNLIQTLSGHNDMITQIILVPKEYICSSALDGEIRVWANDNKESINVEYKCKYILNHHTKAVNAILYYNSCINGPRLVSCSDDGCIKVYEVNGRFKLSQSISNDNNGNNGSTNSTNTSGSNKVMSMILLSNNTIASCYDTGEIKLWKD